MGSLQPKTKQADGLRQMYKQQKLQPNLIKNKIMLLEHGRQFTADDDSQRSK